MIFVPLLKLLKFNLAFISDEFPPTIRSLKNQIGFFEKAQNGTLFLDEVSNLPLDVQATLLRVIQERKFKRVGSNKDIATVVGLGLDELNEIEHYYLSIISYSLYVS